jgi:hypothetical protein
MLQEDIDEQFLLSIEGVYPGDTELDKPFFVITYHGKDYKVLY